MLKNLRKLKTTPSHVAIIQRNVEFSSSSNNNLESNSNSDHAQTSSSQQQKYDVVVVGSNLGSVLARHLQHQSNGKLSVCVVSGGSKLLEQQHLRTAYELGDCSQQDYFIPTQSALKKSQGDERINVQSIDPKSKTVTLKNQQTLNYQKLVIALGLKNDPDVIPGLKAAITALDHPAYSSSIAQWQDSDQKSGAVSILTKEPQWYQKRSGDFFFYIPPFPFKGEISGYNFLLAYD